LSCHASVCVNKVEIAAVAEDYFISMNIGESKKPCLLGMGVQKERAKERCT